MKTDQEAATFTEESLNTLQRAVRFRWDRIVTRHSDGTEHVWLLEDRVAPRTTPGYESPPAEELSEESRVEYASTPCEWPTRSDWTEGRCGRWGHKSVPSYGGGVALCWQHADEAFSDTLARLESGQLNRRQVDRLVRAVLNSDEFKPNGNPDWHPDIPTLIEEQIKEYLIRLLHPSLISKPEDIWFRRRSTTREIDELIDELVEDRIKNKWGVNA